MITSVLVLLFSFSSACAGVTDPEADPDIMQILTELQNEVKDQKRLITSLQNEVTSQKTKIWIPEGEGEVVQSATEDETDRNFAKGRIRRSQSDRMSGGPVAFQAHLTNDLNHIGQSQKITFDSISLNLGNGYHGDHGLFIAPRRGIYIFSGSLLSHHRSVIQMTFVKNGAQLGAGILANSYDRYGFDQGSATIITQLEVNDQVWIQNQWPDDTSVRATQYSCFTGCLIMEL